MKKNEKPSLYFEGLEGRKLEGMKIPKENKRETLNLGLMWRDTLRGNFV